MYYSHVLPIRLCMRSPASFPFSFSFFFNDTATTEIYTLSLHDALPISSVPAGACGRTRLSRMSASLPGIRMWLRSEEHTSELQSLRHLVCRLLLEKKKKKKDKKKYCIKYETNIKSTYRSQNDKTSNRRM